MGELGGVIEWPTQMGAILGAALVNPVGYLQRFSKLCGIVLNNF